MNTNTDSAAFTRLLDDLLWLHARGCNVDAGVRAAVDAMIAKSMDDIPWLRGRRCNSSDVLQEAMDAMIADHTEDANRYSDGSVVWESYDYENPPGYGPSSIRAALHLPPHRRTAERSQHTYRTKFLGCMQFV
jgi:hypothetical protein